jgi:hypothetical protein
MRLPKPVLNAWSGKSKPDQVFCSWGVESRSLLEHPQDSSLPMNLGRTSSSPGRFPLNRASEYVESNFSRRDLEEYLQSRLGGLTPKGALLEIPKYHWQAIFTVNFDNLLEQAYASVPGHVQELKPIYSDRDDISSIPDGSVPLYKLHGCLTLMRTHEGRLALTSDDYSHAIKTRSQLFNRLADSLDQLTILYAGFGRDDEDFREVARRLKEAFIHPEDQRRTYALFPGFEEMDSIRWEREKVTLLNYGADDLFALLGKSLPEEKRFISAGSFIEGEPPRILGKLGSTGAELISLLQKNYDFIDVRINDQDDNTEEFFKGSTPNWGTIAKRIPAKRGIEDEITQSLLVDDSLDHERPYFTLITAEAGSASQLYCEHWPQN